MYFWKMMLFAFVSLLVVSPALAGVAFETSSIARAGDPAPGPSQLGQVFAPSMNDSGQIAFFADFGIFLRTPEGTTLVVAPYDPAPGGGVFIIAGQPIVNEAGEVAFTALVSPPGRNGIFLWSNGKISPIVRKNDPAPGGGVFQAFYETAIKGSGEDLAIAFVGDSGSPIPTGGLFLYSHGAIQRLLRQGDPAPGGGTFLTPSYPSVNLSGQVAFYSWLNPFAIGVFLAQPDGSITQVARTGDPAPEGGTFEFREMDSPPAERRAFAGELTSPPVARRQSLGRGPPLGLQAGDELTGGAAIYSSFARVSLNENGEVAFSASTSVLGSGGIFLYSDGQVSRLVRELDPAPGGGVFNQLRNPVLNAAGQIVFYASTSTFPGFFLFSPETGVVELVRQGQTSPEGDIFTLLGWGDWGQVDINAAGQVVFTAQLTNSLGGIYSAVPGEIARVVGYGDPVDLDPVFIDAFPIGISSTGQVLFAADVLPGGFGLFLGPPATPIVRVGDAAPGGGVFRALDIGTYRASMNDEQIAFVAYRTGDSVLAVYSFADGAFTRIARAGDPAPGGGTFTGFGQLALNNGGDLLLYANATAPSKSGLFLLSGGVYSNVLGIGDSAPGGGTFSSFNFSFLNDLGQIAFLSSVTSPGHDGIFFWSKGVLTPIARSGESAPGGGTYSINGSLRFVPSLNAQGEVAFGAATSMSPAGVVFKFSDGVVTRVAGPGDPFPGGGTILFANWAFLNDLGQVSFFANVTSAPGVALSSEGQLSAVVRAGDPAPGGGTFGAAYVPWINDQTKVGFAGCISTDCEAFDYGVFEASPSDPTKSAALAQ